MTNLDFETVVTTHYATLYRFALSLTGNADEACDLTQQTCYIWATKGHQLRDAEKLKPWLLTTLHREFLSIRTHEARFPHYEMGSVAHELPVITPGMIDEMDAESLMRTLPKIDPLFRAALVLFYLDDLSYKDIADALRVPIGTVMSRLARGKEQLRVLLAVDELERSAGKSSGAGHQETSTHG